MRRKLPSNTALQAFESAARHGNFARAAQELSITEGAISRQIARLENMLDRRLFDRVGNRVRLNAAGTAYAHHVGDILDRLDKETQSLKHLPENSQRLELAVTPTFASRWLIPRLGHFRARHPAITLNIAARSEPFILAGSGFDAAVHFDHPAWTGMRVIPLLAERLIPVCHPSLLLAGDDPFSLLNDLPRIHRRQNPDAWSDYAAETGIHLDHAECGTFYDLHEMAISAVLSGQGVALVPVMYVEYALQTGSLSAPWPAARKLTKQFCLIKPACSCPNEHVLEDFETWLTEESMLTGRAINP